MARAEHNRTPEASGRQVDVPAPRLSAADLSGESFIGREEAARRLGLSLNGFALACQRGEIPGVFRAGRTVRIYWPAVVLAGLGLDVQGLFRELGIRDLGNLVRFLDDQEPLTP